jgi:hypothetical protein
MARLPSAASLFVPDTSETRPTAERIARDLDQSVPEACQLVECCLMLRGGKAVPPLPVCHDHVPTPSDADCSDL